MSMKLRRKYESDAPTTHTRVEADVWDMDCIYGECGHDVPDDAERPHQNCPSSKAIVCEECSEWNSQYEGGFEPWPCENQAVQDWQTTGGKECRYDAMVEAFLRGWRENERRERLHRAMTGSTDRCTCADVLLEGATPAPCPLHGWMGEGHKPSDPS